MMDWPLDDQPVWFPHQAGRFFRSRMRGLNDSFEVRAAAHSSSVEPHRPFRRDDGRSRSRQPLVMSLVLHSFILSSHAPAEKGAFAR
jgi:hypothetical protein